MAIATLTNIERTFGKRILFDKLNFQIDQGERVGLIGDNGSGKTSLFKVLLGQLTIDAGQVSIARSTKLGHLSQDPMLEDSNTVIDEAETAFAELHDLSHRMRDLEHEMAHLSGDELDKILHKYQTTQHEFDLAGGYAWRHRLEATLLGVGLDEKIWEQPVKTLSGGQRSRLALAKLLVDQNDLLLLDEPTNHLDLAAIAWLEEYLAEFNGAVLIISHDRYLLDRLATRIVWLTEARLKSYPGNYSAFAQQRELQELTQQRAHKEQQQYIEKQEEYIRRFQAGQRARQAAGRLKRLETLKSESLVQEVHTNKKIRVKLSTDQRAGDRVLSVSGLSKAYDTRVLWQEIAIEIKRGERVGIIGPNGSGKTTLLESLLGRRDADAGEVRWGANLQIGYYDQTLKDFDPENTVAEEVRGNREVTHAQLLQVLSLMLFRGEAIDKPISLLSGGERARVALAQLLLDRPNILLLDEPTNHLDIPSAEAVEQALRDFPGTILCVSHDRYFLDRVVSRLLVLQPPAIADFSGNFTAWARRQVELAAAAKKSESRKSESKKPQRQQQTPLPVEKADNPWKRPFGRLATPELEQQITQTEIALSEFQDRFSDPELARNPSRRKKLTEEYDALAAKLKQLEEEYFKRNS